MTGLYSAEVFIAGNQSTVDHNEAAGTMVLDGNAPRKSQSLSPFSWDSLYLRMQTSTPWAMLANSLFSTLAFKKSIASCGNETVKETFLVFLDIKGRTSKLLLNISKDNKGLSSILLDGALQT